MSDMSDERLAEIERAYAAVGGAHGIEADLIAEVKWLRAELGKVLDVAEEAAEELHARHEVTESNGAYHVVTKLREAFSDPR